MTDKERADLLAYMEDFKKRVKGNKELARRLLINIGMYTEDLEPAEHLKHYVRPCSTTETV
jgi:hypothetical protein